MRILRIRLRNYRGVVDREVEFAPACITVVQGPNDIGKSSIAEAIDLLLEDLDSTTRERVRATKPVDRDAGPEIELEIETGPYAFRYHKRFLVGRMTQLDVYRPEPENLTGREAHERVQAILAETVDVPLWKALRVQQGIGIEQASLTNAPSLSAALDRAAGGAPAGAEEQALYDRVRAEYEHYFTPTGRPKSEFTTLNRDVAEQETELIDVEEAIVRLDSDIESSARLQANVSRLGERRTEQAEKVKQYEASWQRLSSLEAEVTATEARSEAARRTADQARRDEDARGDAIDALAGGVEERDRLALAAEEAAPALEGAVTRLAGAEAALETARTTREQAQRTAQLRSGDVNFRRDERELSALAERKARLDAALVPLREAEAICATNLVDDEALTAIEAADREVELARARLDTERATVHIETLGDVEVDIDGTLTPLTTGERRDRKIRERFRLAVPGLLAVEVAPGVGDERLDAALRAAETRLAELCEQASVPTATAARAAHDVRRRAEQTRAEQRRIVDDNLGELTTEELDTQLAELRERVGAYRTVREAEPAIASDEGLARREAEEAERERAEAQQSLDRVERERDAARARRDEIEEARRDDVILLNLRREETERLDEALRSARADASDEELARQRAETEREADRLGGEACQTRKRLDQEAPERIETLFENAKGALGAIEQEGRQAEDELLAVNTRLADHGEDGLAEQRDAAVSAHDVAARKLERYSTRAAARKLLHDTMHAAREEAHRAYLAPLRERIERLGSLLFPQDRFAVQLDRELQIVSRSLGGRTVPFASLGGGAREQFGIITRIACAMIVAEDGGVPLILDDALGYSDPQRIEAMGAVLRTAGDHCQVIILTCDPDRYRHVGARRVVPVG